MVVCGKDKDDRFAVKNRPLTLYQATLSSRGCTLNSRECRYLYFSQCQRMRKTEITPSVLWMVVFVPLSLAFRVRGSWYIANLDSWTLLIDINGVALFTSHFAFQRQESSAESMGLVEFSLILCTFSSTTVQRCVHFRCTDA
jgi:hypothetical protein